MAFQNDFSFSWSQWRIFNTCQRRWWLEKVQAWGGWKTTAAPEKRTAYRLKQMSNVWTLAGKTVHEVAKQVVTQGIDVNTALARYDSKMRNGWRQAKIQANLDTCDRPKDVVNLFELFYQGHQIANIDGYARRAFERGRTCVESVFRSTPYRDARAGRIVQAEELCSMQVGRLSADQVKTWLVIDLAYVDTDGVLWLWDWKTGNRGDSERDQMIIYAMYAARESGYDLGDIRLGICYLLDGEEDIFEARAEDLAMMSDRVSRKAAKIRAKLDNPKINEAPASRFPMTEDADECQRCNLFLACKGHRNLVFPTVDEKGEIQCSE